MHDGKPDGPSSSAPLIEYPLDYTFKVMGLAAEDFAEHARRLVTSAAGEETGARTSVRASAGGKYHSVSVAVRLTSEDQRRRVYVALHEDARVVYYL